MTCSTRAFGTPGVLTLKSATGATLGRLDVAAPTDQATAASAFALVDSGGKLAVVDAPPVVNGVPCFLPGTRILTSHGEVAVEALTLDHAAITPDGTAQPITWIGRSRMRAAAYDACPVRIRAGAFGPAMPRRDLLVTPEHCILVDGHLIPARMLVNGGSIVVDAAITEYDYFHVECAAHCVVISEGLPSESFHDDGQRRLFAATLGAARAAAGPLAAPLGVGRELAEPAWHRLCARARQMGFAAALAAAEHARQRAAAPLHEGHGWRLATADGQRLRPVEQSGDRYSFALPPGARGLRLLSATARPSDTLGPFVDDRRALGLLVGEVALRQQNTRHVINPHLNDTELPGWFAREGQHRWTTANATLPITPTSNPTLLEINLSQGQHRTTHTELKHAA